MTIDNRQYLFPSNDGSKTLYTDTISSACFVSGINRLHKEINRIQQIYLKYI